jgi:probable rRNA maturation factor
MTNCEVDIQFATDVPTSQLPTAEQLKTWVAIAALELDQAEVTIRIVDEAESRSLNYQYRHQNKPTNVLSFPFEVPIEFDLPLLGDLVICAPVVVREAAEQAKSLASHWAHMVIHGILHLQGFDHINDRDAVKMERLETELMLKLDFDDPYSN